MRISSPIPIGLFCAFLSLAVPAWITGSSTHAAGLIAQDLDHNTYVDGADFALLFQCLSASDVPHDGTTTCQEADIDYDGDVDMADFGVLQKCYSGTGKPGDPACACVRPKASLALAAVSTPVVSGQSAFVTVAASQEGVSYQLRNNAYNANSGSPVIGTGSTITLQSEPLNSATTFNVLATNVAAGCSVQLNGTVAFTISAYIPHNKIGVHVVIGRRDGFGPFLSDCAAAGKPVAVVKAMDDLGAGDDVKNRSPLTLTMGRVNETSVRDMQGFDHDAEIGTPPAVLAQRVFNELHNGINGQPGKWSLNPWIDVWEICNEWSWWWAYQADFYIAMMDICEASNPPHRIALYGCSYGNPPEAFWPDIARACARAKAHGGHMLSLHEYAPEGTLRNEYETHGDRYVLRYRRLYNYLKQHNADCPLVITEVGQEGGGTFIGTEAFVNDYAWYDSKLREDPYVIGCTAWTLGQWLNANFYPALPALADYIITH